MDQASNETTGNPQGFITRQAVFDAKLGNWGYEILFGQDTAGRAGTDPGLMLEAATRAFLSPRWHQRPDSHLLVGIEHGAGLEAVAGILPKGRTALKVRLDSLADPAVVELLVRLRQENYLIALTRFTGRPQSPAVELADIVCVDMQGPDSPADLAHAVELKERRSIHVMARKLEDRETFVQARDIGATLFEGFFFHKPEGQASGVPAPGIAARLGILGMVEQEEPDIGALAQAIQKDAALTYRLLRFLNSPYFGFTREVSSIKVALILAGWRQMRTWLRLVLVSETAPSHKPGELLFLSAQRGRFLELVAAKAEGASRRDPERLLLVGLFSLLDGIFDMPMADIVAALPLDQELSDTLCGQATRLSPWLALVRGFEAADWPAVFETAAGLGLDPVASAACYTESMQWAHQVYAPLALEREG